MMGQTPELPARATLVRGARQLLTLRGPAGPRRGAALGELGVIPDGAVLIRGGRILEAGPSRRVENLAQARGAREIDASGRVVMPGFVDSRTQPIFATDLTTRRLEARARFVLEGMARHGTTTVAAIAREGPRHSSVIAALRALTALNGQPLDVIPDYNATPLADFGGSLPAYADAICTEMLPVIARRKLALLVSVYCEGRILEHAHSLGFRSTVHGCASAACVRTAVETEAAAMALDRMEPTAMAELSRSRTLATLAPASIYHRGLEYPPARALIETGAAVALASGFGLEQCPTYNMQMVISLACSEMGMSPAEAIAAATVNGACALARGHLCGSLEPSKTADLLLLNVADYREMPEQFGINHVHMVLKNGGVIYQEGEVSSWTGQ